MKRILLVAASAFLFNGIANASEVADSIVEKTLGVTGVKHVTKTKTKYGMTYSDVVYSNQAGQTLLTVRLGTPEQFSFWKQAAGPDLEPLTGLGAEAFSYKSLRSVCAKSATSAACATPDYLLKDPKISNEQLQAVVRAAL